MISMESSGMLARYFVWSCDHLPLTVGRYTVKEDDKEVERCRTGTHYIEHGTTLCHIFWAILWMPLICMAMISLIFFVFGAVHVLLHNDYVRVHDVGPVADVAAYFFPEAFVACVLLLIGSVVLAIVGGSKVGFFNLLWQYIKGIKQHICPLVRFGGAA